MTIYGEIIKKIRQNKGLPLKSVYIDICSKTNAIKFEKGERNLAVDKFVEVLHNLMLTMEEFQWIKNDYKPRVEEYYSYMMSKYWNSYQIAAFEKNLRHIETKAINIERIQLASYRLLESYEKKLAPDKQELALVTNYFSNLSTWTLSDIKFFTNNCYLLPYSLMLYLLKEALKCQTRYQYYQNSERIFAALLTNCVDRMILEKDFSNASISLNLLDKLATDVTMDGYYLLAQYYKAKIIYLNEDLEKGRNMLLKIAEIAKFFDNKQLIIEIENLL
ncbi:transcriptional regulator [Tetragenococcus halophilus subsp. flandriensis]|uniref:Rgg family transcriptional regulator n=1 Tax=Tetragenococcus halophilus TaxID=51669 RepID=UPI0023EA1BF2|nr:hypothetical protein [Tetragenococcus halophilus]GMA08111.1 transcriptional regulator [Tetragenococcus halophilus subsp. flandriensis]